MGLSSSKTKTTTSKSSTPLDQYAPYISRGLTSAQGVLDANQGNLGQMSQSAYGLYNNLANSIGAAGGMLGDAQHMATSIAGASYRGTNPGAQTYGGLMGASNPATAALSRLAQGSSSPARYDEIGTNNPAIDILSGMTNQASNPDSAQFYRDTLAGTYLNGNPYLDAITTQATDAATKAANRRFAAAGMDAGMATPYTQALGQGVADANNRTRYQAYNDELTRMGQIGGQSDAQYSATRDRSLSAASGLGSLYNQTDQLRLAAEQAKNDAFDKDRAAQLAGTEAWGQQHIADGRLALDAGTGADAQYNQQAAQQLQALGLIPELQQAQYAGVTPALAALQAAASIPYTGVNNYADLVNGLTGKYGNETGITTTKQTGNIGQMLSGALGQTFSDVATSGLSKWLKL